MVQVGYQATLERLKSDKNVVLVLNSDGPPGGTIGIGAGGSIAGAAAYGNAPAAFPGYVRHSGSRVGDDANAVRWTWHGNGWHGRGMGMPMGGGT